METPINMNKYVWIYIGITLVIAVLLIAIEIIFDFNFSSSNLPAAICASIFAGGQFYKYENRLPSKSEKRRFAVLSICYSTVLSIAIIAIVLLLSPQSFELPFSALLSPMILGITALVFVVYYFALYFFFGFAAKPRKVTK